MKIKITTLENGTYKVESPNYCKILVDAGRTETHDLLGETENAARVLGISREMLVWLPGEIEIDNSEIARIERD